jgi:hypothetical protein
VGHAVWEWSGKARDFTLWPGTLWLVVFVFVDALADAILLAINSLLFCLAGCAVERGHVFLLAILRPGFGDVYLIG